MNEQSYKKRMLIVKILLALFVVLVIGIIVIVISGNKNNKQVLDTQKGNAYIKDMDLILCMTKSHKQAVIQMYPELKDKVYTLKFLSYFIFKLSLLINLYFLYSLKYFSYTPNAL